jgi:hypothetical protein
MVRFSIKNVRKYVVNQLEKRPDAPNNGYGICGGLRGGYTS